MAGIKDTIEPLALAARGRVLEGRLPVSSLTRLLPLLVLDDPESATQYEAEYVLDFGVDEGGTPRVLGSVKATLPLRCQRCMEKMDFSVSTQTQLGMVSSRSAAEQLPERYDPLLVTGDEDNEISVASIVEDELILALPLVAMHSNEECPQGKAFLSNSETGQQDAPSPQRENPFAVLAQLKSSQSKKSD